MEEQYRTSNRERGKNVLEDEERKSTAESFMEQLNDPLIFILFVAAVISLFLREYGDTVIILAVVLLNAVVGMIQEGKAKRALDALKAMTSPHALIREDGEVKEIPAADLLPGDIVVLEAGCQVPADLELVEAVNLKIEESALTGESVPVSKDVAEHRYAYMSTNVTYGRGEGRVTAIGMDTEIGKIAGMLRGVGTQMTPLQKRLADLGKVLSTVSIFLCLLLFFIAVLQKRDIAEMLITAISLAVAAVPEGLPAIVTMVLALSVSRMVKVHTIVKRLPSVETLGCVSVVCSDKTGTLTQNRMTVTKCYVNGKVLETERLQPEQERHFIRGFVLCNDASLRGGERRGDPTELALADLGARFGVMREELEKTLPRVDELAFDSDRKMMTTMHREGNRRISYTKGSPDEILERCRYVLNGGERTPFTPSVKKQILKGLSVMTAGGLRVLALGMREDVSGIEENGLTFLGFAGMEDPIRPEAAEAVREFRRAGVRTIMITGDRADTALAIARQLGIAGDEKECVTGEELEHMGDEELAVRIAGTSVFAHVSPEHKVRIVSACRKNGEIAAMTGDGVNDAPSLKSADVGIAMGMSGTDVAAPLKSSHILWINLITDSLPALALGIDEEENKSYMDRPPRSGGESLFAGGGWACTCFYGVLIAVISMTAFLQYPIGLLLQEGMAVTPAGIGRLLAETEILNRCQTYAFTVLGMAQLFHAIGMRDVETSLFRMNHLENRLMIVAIFVGIGLQLLVTEIPYFISLFGTCKLSVFEWVRLLILASMPLLAHEILVLLACVGRCENGEKAVTKQRAAVSGVGQDGPRSEQKDGGRYERWH